ncbi:hypothetical protein OCAE111667_22695 [Occultella aeris]|uniref:Twin-arginine translocation signal domain-containing protein n=1 Tax=Occultella aeris TaxID=2761496 RepID=A0A7M4DQQ4_9MICO|nr:hypothetical protein [Occultella aeris]VZO39798.1 hypothetical protein HALOF300_04495 [Occultella aeris]
MRTSRRAFLGALAAAGAVVATAPTAVAAPVTRAGGNARLANLDHLRFLLGEVPLTPSTAHTTYRIDAEPVALAPWTYADADGGSFRRVGGGAFDPATGYYGQGAFNADDIARAAVVFLRDWHASGDVRSRGHAYENLRALAYLQTVDGPNTGRVVLWQQFDGSLNPSAEPVELPDPSDSAESYWLARTVWALGEGYAAFSGEDDGFAAFLSERLHLALDALDEESLSRYGQFVTSDGVDLPAWLIGGGADATAEAVLGLAATQAAMPDDRVGSALERYAEGIAAMGTATAGWPFGAVLPWTGSLGFWHAWGGAAPEALARAGETLGRDDLIDVAITDAGTFTPLVLACGGPNNAWAPLPAEAQIAYGAHGRVAAALAAADADGGPGLRELAGLAAGWFFGANTAGTAVYDPATGVTFDGVETDGRINRNSGAESTIHGQLTMLALDTRPDVAALARSITSLHAFEGLSAVDAETARFSAGCTVVTPSGGAWMGEGNLSGGAYLQVPAGEWVEFDLDAEQAALAYPIVWRTDAEAGTARWSVVGGAALGVTANGGTGAAGLTEVPGSLVPQGLDDVVPAGVVTVRCESDGDLRLDALLLRPLVTTAHYATTGTDAVLYVNAGDRVTLTPALAGGTARAYTGSGRQRGQMRAGRQVRVVEGGFTISR